MAKDKDEKIADIMNADYEPARVGQVRSGILEDLSCGDGDKIPPYGIDVAVIDDIHGLSWHYDHVVVHGDPHLRDYILMVLKGWPPQNYFAAASKAAKMQIKKASAKPTAKK